MKHVIVTILASALGLGLASCSDEDDEIVACFYEERASACGGGNYGPWEANCIEIENGKACSEIVMSDTICESTCCVNFEVRDREEVAGASCDE